VDEILIGEAVADDAQGVQRAEVGEEKVHPQGLELFGARLDVAVCGSR
jgi:hypothetical protein